MVKLIFGIICGLLLFGTVGAFFLGFADVGIFLFIALVLIFIIGRNVVNACERSKNVF